MAKKKVSVSKRYTPPPKKARSNISSKKTAPKRQPAAPIRKPAKQDFNLKTFQNLFKKEIEKKAQTRSKIAYNPKSTKPAQKQSQPTKKQVKKPAGKGSFKDKYIELLEKTVKEHDKDIKEIKNVINQPGFRGPLPPDYEAFPKEDFLSEIPSKPAEPGSVEDQILQLLKDIQQQMHQRNVMFDELVHGSGKLD